MLHRRCAARMHPSVVTTDIAVSPLPCGAPARGRRIPPHLGFIPVGIGAVSFPGAGRGAELMGSIVLSHGRAQQLPQGTA